MKMFESMQKNYYCILLIVFIVLITHDRVSAISCKELDTPKKIKSFMNESHLSSPFLQKNVSVTVILDACEGKVCKSKSKRESQKETLSIQRLDNKRRIYAEKGPNSPNSSSSAAAHPARPAPGRTGTPRNAAQRTGTHHNTLR